MQIFFILPSLKLGGAEKVFTKLLNAWKFDNTKVTLIVLDGRGAKLKINNRRVKVIVKHFNRVFFSFFFLYKYLSTNNVQVVISTSSNLNTLLLIIKKLSFRKFKLLIRDASVSSIMEKYGVRKLPKLVRGIILRTKMKLYPYADKIICQSEDIAEDIISTLNLKDETLLKVIPNPLEFFDYGLHYEETDLNKRLVFITVARFMPVKGHDRLIRIFSKVKRPYCLKLVGEGPERLSVESMVEKYKMTDKVTFMGAVVPPYKEIIESDVYVQASYVEGFPNALLESLGHGLPAIAFNVPGGTREIMNDKNGILVENGNEDAFVDAIETIRPKSYSNKWIAKDVYERFGIEKILEQYKQIILEEA